MKKKSKSSKKVPNSSTIEARNLPTPLPPWSDKVNLTVLEHYTKYYRVYYIVQPNHMLIYNVNSLYAS